MSTLNVNGPAAEIKMQVGTVPAAQTAGTVNGTGIDRLGFDFAIVEVQTGAVTGAPSAQTLDVKIQHSDASGSGYTDLTGASVAQITAANARKRKTVDLRGAKRYIRAVTVAGFTGGTTPALANSAIIALAGASVLPAQADD